MPAVCDANWKPPETGTGAGLAIAFVVPVPSSPTAFIPQQYAAFAVVIPHVNASPAARLENDKVPCTRFGTPAVPPVPPSPQLLLPQQYATLATDVTL